MKSLTRPTSQIGWGGFSSSAQVAWKTGTSFGFKDAWAVGLTDRYVVGVWAGNSDGEGRPGLTGVGVAAPILFDVVGKLNDSYRYPANTSESHHRRPAGGYVPPHLPRRERLPPGSYTTN